MSEYNPGNMTVWAAGKAIIGALSPKYGEREARAMMQFIFENLKGWTTVDLAIKANETLTPFMEEKINGVVARIMNDEPVQYIFGVADFYGMKIHVSRDTLIPRPETAELVDWIVEENNRKDLRVIDLGTGSGCIAIALARNLPFASVTGVDISADALAVAKENARRLFARVDFVRADILKPSGDAAGSLPGGRFDIIVSNPPYIAEKERAGMDRNVLDYEPWQALFVPDSDPLEFYDAILRYAEESLVSDGHIYFEINPLFSADLTALCRRYGFRDVTVRRDSFGKERFMKVSS